MGALKYHHIVLRESACSDKRKICLSMCLLISLSDQTSPAVLTMSMASDERLSAIVVTASRALGPEIGIRPEVLAGKALKDFWACLS